MNYANRKKSPKIPLLIALAVLLLAGAVTAFAYFQKLGPFANRSESDSNSTAATNTVDYSGPSDNDIAESQDAKKNAGSSADSSSDAANSSSGSSNTSKKTANVGISYADINSKNNLEIRAFVNNIIEGDGTCTATVTKGSTTITKTSEAFIDTSSSICEPIYIPKSQLSAGEWSVNVKYSSPNATGSSGPEKVTIP